MAKFIIAAKGSAKTTATTRIGGMPRAPKGTSWPRCKECKGRMMFLAQIYLPDTGIASLAERDQLLLVFQCQNNPGMCDDWDPDLGGNAVLVVSTAGLVPLPPPVPTPVDREEGTNGPIYLDQAQAVRAADYDYTRHDESDDDAYVEALQKQGSGVVGKLGGRPAWIQGDETPKCSCRRKMIFVAQIEHNAAAGINFGDCGSGYVFNCGHCKDKAKFTWQCS
jgi:uncharacterized protein YwqG